VSRPVFAAGDYSSDQAGDGASADCDCDEGH
jgi:hypothetical protein